MSKVRFVNRDFMGVIALGPSYKGIKGVGNVTLRLQNRIGNEMETVVILGRNTAHTVLYLLYKYSMGTLRIKTASTWTLPFTPPHDGEPNGKEKGTFLGTKLVYGVKGIIASVLMCGH